MHHRRGEHRADQRSAQSRGGADLQTKDIGRHNRRLRQADDVGESKCAIFIKKSARQQQSCRDDEEEQRKQNERHEAEPGDDIHLWPFHFDRLCGGKRRYRRQDDSSSKSAATSRNRSCRKRPWRNRCRKNHKSALRGVCAGQIWLKCSTRCLTWQQLHPPSHPTAWKQLPWWRSADRGWGT